MAIQISSWQSKNQYLQRFCKHICQQYCKQSCKHDNNCVYSSHSKHLPPVRYFIIGMVNLKMSIMADEKLEKAAEEEDQTDLWDPTLPPEHPYYNFTKEEYEQDVRQQGNG